MVGAIAGVVLLSVVWALSRAQRPRVVSPTERTGSTSESPGSGKLIQVARNGNFQAALNAAQPGDTIVLQAGATYSGSYVLPLKSDTQYITVQSSRAGELAAGVRVSPQQAGLMARLQSPSVDAALQTVPGSHHYQFVGIEFTSSSAAAFSYGVVKFGDGDSAGPQTTLAAVPHHLIVDRCYIHGIVGQNVQRGIALNSAETSILNSYIAEIHWAGADTQAVGGWNGPGPFHIINNYLEAAGENVMFGGAASAIPNLVPADIEIRRNYVVKPLRWKVGDPSYDGSNWTIKNLLELKTGRRVTIDGNVFENNWAQSQTGFAILFNCINDTGSWARIEDVVFTNNIVRHSGNGFNIRARDEIGSFAARIKISNNVFDDISHRWGGTGILFQLLRGTKDLVIEHNTGINDGTAIVLDGEPNQNLSIQNNIIFHNAYGVFGNGGAIGKTALDQYAKGWSFDRNVLIGVPADIPTSQYPANNYFPASIDSVGFANHKSGDYRLTQNSRFKGKGSDGKDIGCNVDLLPEGQPGG